MRSSQGQKGLHRTPDYQGVGVDMHCARNGFHQVGFEEHPFSPDICFSNPQFPQTVPDHGLEIRLVVGDFADESPFIPAADSEFFPQQVA
jgi:hypothetical protein